VCVCVHKRRMWGVRGYACPHFLEWGVQYPPLFRHAWHNFWWKVVNLMSSLETETTFISHKLSKTLQTTIFVSEYGWKCTILHKKKTFSHTFGAEDTIFVPPLVRLKLRPCVCTSA